MITDDQNKTGASFSMKIFLLNFKLVPSKILSTNGLKSQKQRD